MSLSMSREELLARWAEALARRGRCPRCNGLRVWHNGIRWRKATLRSDGRSEFFGEIPVRRLCCGDCPQRWCHAPEAVVAPAHYQPCVVAEAVAREVLDGATPVAEVAR